MPSKVLLLVVVIVVAYLAYRWWSSRQKTEQLGLRAPSAKPAKPTAEADFEIVPVDPGSLGPIGGSVTQQEAIAQSMPPREPGDTSSRPEDARIYVGGAAPAKGGAVLPIGKECPPSHPVKGNVNSGLYHDTTMATWLHTSPEECFADGASAEAAGYRLPTMIQRATPEQQAEIAQRLASVKVD